MTNGTTDKGEKKPRPDDALNELYGDRVFDLTSEGFGNAIGKLRSRDLTRARQVERLLAPLLKERVFPRRSKPWRGSSVGTRARLALLPQNPHLQADIEFVREVLGVPDDQIKPTDDYILWRKLEGVIRPGVHRQAVERLLAGPWLLVHRMSAQSRTLDDPSARMLRPDVPGVDLPPDLGDTAEASAQVDLTGNGMPEWLRRSPDNLDSTRRHEAPIDWASARLLERHHLPKRLAGVMVAYILTLNPDWIEGLEPLEVKVTHPGGSATDRQDFAVVVKGLDEYVTKADWGRIWETYVNPWQQEFWKARGQKPQGRRAVDLNRLKKSMPMYVEMVQDGISETELFGRPHMESDQETIRRALRDLRTLLEPEK